MSRYEQVCEQLVRSPRTWLITGVAGFIGSNVLEKLLMLEQRVVGLDNFSTGYRRNLEEVKEAVGERRWSRFRLIEGDIRSIEVCRHACEDVDLVLHQAALGSVPRSISDPISSSSVNVTGFLNLLVAVRDSNVSRIVYAASSSAYGDHPMLPKVEGAIGNPLSPYAVTKYVNELYAGVFSRCYGVEAIGLRYFNVFGPRQDPNGAYAAVIPKWTMKMIHGNKVFLNGDGETSRDFCFIANAVQANLLAATSTNPEAVNEVYNVAVGERTSLNQLFEEIRKLLVRRLPHLQGATPVYRDFRPGDVRHSLADISKARGLLGYCPSHRIGEGLTIAVPWYVERRSWASRGSMANVAGS